jgi:hypothetical protein
VRQGLIASKTRNQAPPAKGLAALHEWEDNFYDGKVINRCIGPNSDYDSLKTGCNLLRRPGVKKKSINGCMSASVHHAMGDITYQKWMRARVKKRIASRRMRPRAPKGRLTGSLGRLGRHSRIRCRLGSKMEAFCRGSVPQSCDTAVSSVQTPETLNPKPNTLNPKPSPWTIDNNMQQAKGRRLKDLGLYTRNPDWLAIGDW